MREFFIGALDKLVAVIIILMAIFVVIAGIGAMFAPAQPGMPPSALLGILILIGGAFYIVVIGGSLYLALGIYYNTKRTADALVQRPL
ncbi:hypothetical protein HKCCE2091_00830 [Rhodobacterales bacterium HKCCE2091]|nr:hypothetical protein [Rhodobacterales bacterium HKCCE2091]